MQSRNWTAFGLALALFGSLGLGTQNASAWETMRCGNRLVDVGDPLYRVKEICGPPDQEDASVEYHTVRQRVRTTCRMQGSQRVCNDVYAEHTVEVPIHRLTYDFGRNRFVHYLRFEHTRLVSVESGDYGVKSSDSH
jgi:Protein of unknown function (DUF2845)